MTDGMGMSSYQIWYLLPAVLMLAIWICKRPDAKPFLAFAVFISILLTHLGACNPLMGAGQMSMDHPCCMAQQMAVDPPNPVLPIAFAFQPYASGTLRLPVLSLGHPSNKPPPLEGIVPIG